MDIRSAASPSPSLAPAATRRGLLSAAALLGGTLALSCGVPSSPAFAREGSLPPADPDPDDMFSVDRNVNMETIDDYLGIDGVCYRDMRMVKDPADYAAIGGDAVLSIGLEGFKTVPFPYVATLQQLPVQGAYEGRRLFDVEWGEDGQPVSIQACFEESQMVVEDLFPRGRPIVLCCGGGGYAGMMRRLLIGMGYDPALLYNAGGVWDYTGYHAVEYARHDEKTGKTSYFLWRADIATIDFDQMTSLGA